MTRRTGQHKAEYRSGGHWYVCRWLAAACLCSGVLLPRVNQAADDLHPVLRSAFTDFQQREYWQADGQVELLLHGAGDQALHQQAAQLRGVIDLALAAPKSAEREFLRLATQGRNMDRAWLNLARWAARHGDMPLLSEQLSRLTRPLSGEAENERRMLMATLALQRRQPTQAVAALEGMDATAEMAPYARYNLGVALWQDGQPQRSRAVFESLASSLTSDADQQALRDRIYVGLGHAALAGHRLDEARGYFERVRLDSMYAGAALLGMSATWLAAGDAGAALPYLDELLQHSSGSNDEVQQARLVSAQVYQQLGDAPQALSRYQQADRLYAQQIQALDATAHTLGDERVLDELVSVVVNDDWQRLNTPVLRAARDWLKVLCYDYRLRDTLQTLADLHVQQRELLAMQQRIAALTPAHIAAVRKGIRVKAAPVTPAQRQRLLRLRTALPVLQQRSNTLLQQQRERAVLQLRAAIADRTEALRNYQALVRHGIAEILDDGLRSESRNR